jgi:hypothetical protein
MIRWKQAEVHRKRRERQDKIKALQMETSFNTGVITNLNTLLNPPTQQQQQPLSVFGAVKALCTFLSETDKKLAHDVMVRFDLLFPFCNQLFLFLLLFW